MKRRIITIRMSPRNLPQRLQTYPIHLSKEIREAHKDALKVTHQATPGYPAPPPRSRYIRTERLGQGLGSGFGGGASGIPSIYETRPMGVGQFNSRIGSSWPHYNEDVIGAGRQAPIHVGRWWTDKTWAEMATPDIVQQFADMASRVVKWLNGK